MAKQSKRRSPRKRKEPELTIVIKAWPALIEHLDRHRMFGDTPAEIAKHLIIDGLERRRVAQLEREAIAQGQQVAIRNAQGR